MSTSVAAQQRFKRNNPCPVCGGGTDDPQGQGVRCYGFLSSDGEYAHCTREDHAGSLQKYSDGTYVHRLVSGCRCGVTHDTRPQPAHVTPKRERSPMVHEERYEARDADASFAAYKWRREFADGSKTFHWQQADGTWGLNGRSATQMPLYGADEVSTARSVIVAEGERAKQAITAKRLPGVGTMTGADTIPSDESLQAIVSKDVIYLWPDNDDKGRRHMDRIAERLTALGAADVRIVVWTDAPEKGDAADFIGPLTTRDDVKSLIRSAVPWTPKVANEGEDCHTKQGGHLREEWQPSGVTRLSEVTPETLRWLWPGRIPLGKLTIWDGDPGLGKTLALGDIAARVSVGGVMPDGSRSDVPGPASVLIQTAEDGIADTIVPRMHVAGADLTRIVSYSVFDDEGNERAPVIPDDLDAIENLIRAEGIVLVIIDPLMAFLSGDVNAHRDQDVRRALARLSAMSERTGAAIVCIRHLNKMSGANALYRGGGSIGIVGAARSALIVAKDPDDESGDRRIVAMSKANLAAPAPSLAYHIAATPENVPYIVWEGPTSHTASALLSQPQNDDERSERDDARSFLTEILQSGPINAKTVLQEARGAGISERTLHRAKKSLGIASRKTGMDGGWQWDLPNIAKVAEDVHYQTGGNLQDAWQPSTAPTPQPTTDIGACTSCGSALMTPESEAAGMCATCRHRIEGVT